MGADQAPRLGELLADQDWNVRLNAIRALGAMGPAAADQAPRLGELLTDQDEDVRQAAAQALGAMGPAAADQAPRLRELFTDLYSEVRDAAAQALGAMGADQAPRLGELLADQDWEVREVAAQALEAMGPAAADQAPRLRELLVDPSWYVRLNAVQALGAMGPAAADQAPRLGELLTDQEWNLQSDAAQALGAMGPAAADQAPRLGKLLAHQHPDIREAAAQALGAMGPAAADQTPRLRELLADQKWDVREAAAQALGAMGADQAPRLGELLADQRPYVRKAAAQALGAMGPAAADQAPRLGKLLAHQDKDVRKAAAQALGAMGPAAADQVPRLGELLADQEWDVRGAAAHALEAMGPFAIDRIPSIASAIYRSRAVTGEVRFLAHFLGGGVESVETLLTWIGAPHPQHSSLKAASNDHQRARQALATFRDAWPGTENYPDVRRDLERQIARLIDQISWDYRDLPLLIRHETNLALIGSTNAAAIRQKIWLTRGFGWVLSVLGIVAFHAVFWLALIFVYPRSSHVQAMFFWNKWARRIAGFGYVGVLLAWAPPLRRLLFAPFKQSLLADARLGEFRQASYFANSEVVAAQGQQAGAVTKVLADMRGQLVLQGESGLGKSMFLRHFVRDSKRLLVFLLASRCQGGVLEAIQAKLHGPAKDPDFLKKLIFAGALDVVIDGLNEVSAETRARIISFADEHFRGNLIMATQPMVWHPPALAKVFILQPLKEEQIEAFLTSRVSSLPKDAETKGDKFEQRCRDYLRNAFDKTKPEPNLRAIRQVLSNPMDLSVVAQILGQGQIPDIFKLQDQHYQVVAEQYQREHQGQKFPMERFVARVYEMRLHDENLFVRDEFANELAVMAEHKMVVPQYREEEKDTELPRWTFRHDKIMDYFLVKAFLGEDNPRPAKHLGDARFRGAYSQLAMLLPLDAANLLERQLIIYAADTKDHSVSDNFVQLLRNRTEAQISYR